MKCSPRELLQRCPDPWEIAEMMAQHALTPWGEIADDYRAGVVGLGIAKAALGNPVTGKDFVIEFGDKQQTPEQMSKTLRGMSYGAPN